jgi:hypothetical protein
LCTPFTVDIRDAFAPTHGAVIVGTAETNLPTALGGQLLVTPSWIIAFAVPQSAVSLPMDVCDASFCGLSIYLQVMVFDPGAKQLVSFTPGLRLDLGSF